MDKPEVSGNFVIRVYGILINDHNEVLLSDEFRLGMYMTKFPGGGLRYGEGPEECLHREAIEEFGQEIDIISHFYTTGFFQQAMFYENRQLISIYYRIRLRRPPAFRISTTRYDFDTPREGSQSFRWKSLDDLCEQDVSFPVDRFVVSMLTGRHGKTG